jgi:hypothetical protein
VELTYIKNYDLTGVIYPAVVLDVNGEKQHTDIHGSLLYNFIYKMVERLKQVVRLRRIK